MPKHTYNKISLTEKAALGLEEQAASQHARKSSRSVPWITCMILCLLSSSASLVLGFYLAVHGSENDLDCIRKHSAYSPALEHIDPSYRPVLYNGTLARDSIYKGEPRPEMEEAWKQLTDFNITYITREELARLPGQPDSARMPPQAHISGSYFGSVEVFHQLHCLNMLRKMNVWDYDHYKAAGDFTDPLPLQKQHHGHCIDMLRQVLQCNADVGIVPFRYVEGRVDPYPNFNTWHMCRNYDSVLDFARSRHIGEGWDRNYVHRQPDEKLWAQPP